MTMRLVNWNVGWATPWSQRTPEILSRIHSMAESSYRYSRRPVIPVFAIGKPPSHPSGQ